MHSSRRDGVYGQYGSGQQYNAYNPQQPYGQQQDGSAGFGHGNTPAQNPQHTYQAYSNHQTGQSPDLAGQNYAGGSSPPIQTTGYNPAHYAAPGQPVASPIASRAPLQMPGGNYADAHIPYNPAAYASSSPSLNNSYQPYQPSPVSSYGHLQTPPLPPKPPELTQQTAGPYPRPPAERRGAVATSGADGYIPYAPQSPPVSYGGGYTPPVPPAPPSHGMNGTGVYQPYTSSAQAGHRRLPSIPQDENASQDQNSDSQQGGVGWSARVPGALLPANSQSPSQHSPHRTTSSASAISRPLPPTPDYGYGDVENGDQAQLQADLYAQLEGHLDTSRTRPPTITRRPVGRPPTDSASRNGTSSLSGPDSLGIVPDAQMAGGTSRTSASATSGPLDYNPGDESDPDGRWGLEAMQIAEREEQERQTRHGSIASVVSADTAIAPQPPPHANDEEMLGSYDISETFHPGFDPAARGPLHSPPIDGFSGGTAGPISFPQDSFGRTTYEDDLYSPRMTARVDTGDTGGLAEPTAVPRRMSFDDGDEDTLVDHGDHRSSSSVSPGVFDNRELHRTGSGRPLPPTPNSDGTLTAGTNLRQGYSGHDKPIKANSLSGPAHPHGLVPPVGRSITDADQKRGRGNRSSYYDMQGRTDVTGPELDLPSIPAGRRRKFVANKLGTKDYAECTEPWAISNVLSWIKAMTEGESDLKKQPIVDALIGLFTHKIPTMNIADAEVLAAYLVDQMFHEAALVRDEEWVKFSPLKMTGVIYQLTGAGCYSNRVHHTTTEEATSAAQLTAPRQNRCYSHMCMRTLKKIDLQAQQLAPERKAEDWTTFYKVPQEVIKERDPKEVELQYMLHEVVTSEDYFIDQLDVLLVLYRDGLANNDKPIIALTGKQSKFLGDVFGKVPAVKKVNEQYLLSDLKYRQQEQGPWIVGFSDIFREWIRHARKAYIDYAAGLPSAISQVRQQSEQNPLFKQFLDQVREHPRSKRLDWQTYLKAPITRLQRYSLLLATVHKNMKKESREKTNLVEAIREIREATAECDSKYADELRRTDMTELSNKLKLRPAMENVQLNLNHLGRQIIHRGELTRRGNNSVSWVDGHAILFDHFFVLAKPMRKQDANGVIKSEYYDVSKPPIPMDLLVLESADDGIVMKHAMRGIVPLPTTTIAKPIAGAGQDNRLVRTPTAPQVNGMPPNGRSLSSPTTPGQPGMPAANTTVDTKDLLYPFRVQHLGRSESYTLYATTVQIRQDWVEKITLAKKNHAASLFAQNAEPFHLRILADSAFAYNTAEFIDTPPVHIPGTPLDRALRDLERDQGKPDSRTAPICRSSVNCATAFSPPLSDRHMLAVGTDFGVFITEQNSPRGWYKAINATSVTQISVLEDFSVLLIIADKALIAFHLDAVCPPQGGPANNTADQKRTPQKLSGSRDVGFFSVGRMKERMLVFYKKKDGISSTFKVLEPVHHKSSTASSSGSGWGRSRFGLKKGTTEFFRDFDDFYIATDTYAINIFASSLGIATQKGIEVLTLDKKVPFSIPDLRAPEVQNIAQRIQHQRPLGMFRLTDSEFLLVFEEIGIYCDKHGDISRAVVMEFVGKARQASLHQGTYLVLVDSTGGFVEVRNAMNGRLRQVIPGKDVKMLDDGMAAGFCTAGASVQPGVSRGHIKISMMHPETRGGYVVLEMLVNENIREGA